MYPGSIESWSVEDVCRALAHEFGSLPEGLGATLRENAVDGPFLMTLSDDDLMNELGCTKLQVKKVRRMIDEATKAASGNSEPPQSVPADIPQPLPCQPPPPGGAYGVPPSGYPSGGMGTQMYNTPGYGGVPSSPFSQNPGQGMVQQQPVPQQYGGQGVGMPPPLYYAPPNYNQMGPYDQYAQQQQQQQQGCACSIM